MHTTRERYTPPAADEGARLRSLRELGLLDRKPDPRVDDIVRLASKVFRVPTCGASIVGKNQQWFTSAVGTELAPVSRKHSFCSHVVAQGATVVVPDATLDEHLKDNPFVQGEPKVRFYAGAPIYTTNGFISGALCIVDTKPRADLTVEEIGILELFANMASRCTQHRHAAEELQGDESQVMPKRHALIAMSTVDGVWEWLRSEREVYYSSRCQQLLGLPENDLLATPNYWLSRVHDHDRFTVMRQMARQLRGEGNSFHSEHRVRHTDGSWRWVKAQGFLTRDEDGRCERIVGSFVDVTTIRGTDALTGLPNRSTFIDRLGDLLQIALLNDTTSPVVMMVDVDCFARLNDRLGNATADRILRDIGQRLTNAVSCLNAGRRSLVARHDGDRFLVLLENVEDVAAADLLAQRIQDALNVPFASDGYPIQIEVSIGIAIARPHHKAHQLIENAQIACKEATSSGRRARMVFTPKMLEESTVRARLESGMREAIEQGELRVFYQPQFDLRSGKLNGCEALVRWQHPQFGLLFPDAFLRLAEENGLIGEIDRWVMREACEQMARWKSQYRSAEDLRISVNISSSKFSELRLQSTITRLLEETGLEPSALCLEITETVLMHDIEDAIPILESLRQIGVGLHIDDFGAGYSSFAQLYDLPFDTLKIDRSFMKRVLVDTKARAIVEALLGLAKRLGLSIIAEGVEEDAHRVLLKKLGCHSAQGYFYSKPIPALQFEKLLLASAPNATHLPDECESLALTDVAA